MFLHFLLRARSLAALCFVGLLSCSAPPSPEPLMFKAFRENFDNSARNIHLRNEVLYSQLAIRAEDSIEGIKVRLWKPRIDSVWAYTKEMNDYLTTLEKELAAERGVAALDSFSGRRGPELYQRLMDHRERLLAIDPLFASTFREGQYFMPNTSGCYKSGPAFTAAFFDATPGAAEAALAQFRNIVQVMCSHLLTFCNENTQINFDDFYVYSGVTSLSSSIVRAGEQLVVTAGVVSFSRHSQAGITINGAEAPLREDGYASYKLKAAAEPGKHIIRVGMQYRDQDGKVMRIQRDLPYEVIGNDVNN